MIGFGDIGGGGDGLRVEIRADLCRLYEATKLGAKRLSKTSEERPDMNFLHDRYFEALIGAILFALLAGAFSDLLVSSHPPKVPGFDLPSAPPVKAAAPAAAAPSKAKH
jgi:hypothetical protein